MPDDINDIDNLAPADSGGFDWPAELRAVVTMTIPVVITTSSRGIMDVADYFMLGLTTGDDTRAAIVPAQLLMWTYLVIGMGIVSMVNTFAAQSLGRKRYHECAIPAWQGLYVATAVGFLAFGLRSLTPVMIRWVGHDAPIQALEQTYLNIALLTAGPTVAAHGLGQFFIGVHSPRVTMWAVVESNVINILVSMVLIFGYFGFEPMGIAGAAWGTVVGVSYQTVRLMIAMLRPSFHERYATRTAWRHSLRGIDKLLTTGIPCGLQSMCDVLVWALFVNVLIGRFGQVHLVATNTAWQYLRISYLPTLGAGQALTALVGRSIGAGDADRAIRETRMAVTIVALFMGVLSVTYWLFGPALIRVFGNENPQVIEIGAKIMICAAFFQLFDGVGIAYTSALRGAADTLVPSTVYIISLWAVVMGGGWAMAEYIPQLESIGPWLAASVLIAFTGLFMWYRWRSRAWLRHGVV